VADDQDAITKLQGYGILDTPNEAAFDAIVHDAAHEMQTPIALISLLDENRQWFKARVGLAASQTPLSISFCTHAVRGAGVFEVADARRDERFSHNPLVTGDPNIRFYAGATLKTSGGTRIGTLCVIDTAPREGLSDQQKARLTELADRVVAVLEERKRRGKAVRLA